MSWRISGGGHLLHDFWFCGGGSTARLLQNFREDFLPFFREGERTVCFVVGYVGYVRRREGGSASLVRWGNVVGAGWVGGAGESVCLGVKSSRAERLV